MLSKEEVKKIAQLARIRLSDEEEVQTQKDLSAVLDYVEKLNEVDTSMVGPTLGGVKAINVVREDFARNDLIGKEESAAKIVNSAPEHEDGLIKVKAVL